MSAEAGNEELSGVLRCQKKSVSSSLSAGTHIDLLGLTSQLSSAKICVCVCFCVQASKVPTYEWIIVRQQTAASARPVGTSSFGSFPANMP